MEDLQALSGLDLSSLIDKISKNPEIMNAAKDMLSSIQSGEATPSAPPEKASDSVGLNTRNELSTLLPVLNSMSNAGASQHSNRDALLKALRPYLSKERCDALDRLLSIEKLGVILSGIEKGRTANGSK